MVVSERGVQVERFWSLDRQSEVRLPSDEAYAEAFRALFGEAVQSCLRSAFPVGASLSGGLDSSSIVCVARDALSQEESGRRLHVFSCLFDELPQCDERDYIAPIVADGRLAAHLLRGDQQNPLGDLEKAFWHLDEPCIGPNLYLPWSLNRTAQAANVRVLLDGFDGDTTVSHGDFWLTELAYRGEWEVFVAEASQLAEAFNCTPATFLHTHGLVALNTLAQRQRWRAFAREVDAVARHFSISRRYLWLHYGVWPNVPAPIRHLWHTLRGRIPQRNTLIGQQFAQRIQMDEHAGQLAAPQARPPQTLQEEHWRTLTSGGLSYVLELNDKTAAAWTLDARHPFMDKRLIEFCLAVPAHQKLHRGWSRRILREAMNGILPEAVRLRRSKTNLEPNFVYTLLLFERARMDALIFSDPTVPKAYMDWSVVQNAYRRLCTWTFRSEDIATVWKAVNLTLWLRYTGLAHA
jgi:asparagine synthase (glutamine-hydrolysing)